MCAMRLSPLDPMIGQMQAGAAHAHFVVGHHEEASAWAGRAVRGRPNWIPGVIVAAASTALCGRLLAKPAPKSPSDDLILGAPAGVAGAHSLQSFYVCPYWVRRGKVTPSFLRACSSTGMPSAVLPVWHCAIAVGTVALGPRCCGAVFR